MGIQTGDQALGFHSANQIEINGTTPPGEREELDDCGTLLLSAPFPDFPPMDEPIWMDEPVVSHPRNSSLTPITVTPREIIRLLSEKTAIPLSRWRLIGGANRAAMTDTWLRTAIHQLSPDISLPEIPLGSHENLPDYDFYLELGEINIAPFRKIHDQIIEVFTELYRKNGGRQAEVSCDSVRQMGFQGIFFRPEERLFILKVGAEEGKQIEIKIAGKLTRDHLFSIDGFYRTLDDLTTLHSVQENPYQGVIDLARGVIRCENPDQVNHKGWPRYISYISRGFRTLQPGLSETLFRTCAEIPPFEFLLELEECLERHHPGDSSFAAALLLNATMELIRIGENEFATDLLAEKTWSLAEGERFNRQLRRGTHREESLFSTLQNPGEITPLIALANSLIQNPESLNTVLPLLQASCWMSKSPVVEHCQNETFQFSLPTQHETATLLVPTEPEHHWEFLAGADLAPYQQWILYLLRQVNGEKNILPTSLFLEKPDIAHQCFGAVMAKGNNHPCPRLEGLDEDSSAEEAFIFDLLESPNPDYRAIGHLHWKRRPTGDLQPIIMKLITERQDFTLAISLFQKGSENELLQRQAKMDTFQQLCLPMQKAPEATRLTLLPRIGQSALNLEGDRRLCQCFAWLIRELIRIDDIDTARKIFRDKDSLPPRSCERIVTACRFATHHLDREEISPAYELWWEELTHLPRGDSSTNKYKATIAERQRVHDQLLLHLNGEKDPEKLTRVLQDRRCQTECRAEDVATMWIKAFSYIIERGQKDRLWELWKEAFPHLLQSDSPEEVLQIIDRILHLGGQTPDQTLTLYTCFSHLIQQKRKSLPDPSLLQTALLFVEKIPTHSTLEQKRKKVIHSLLDDPIMDCAPPDEERVDALLQEHKNHLKQFSSKELREKTVRFYLARKCPRKGEEFLNQQTDLSLLLDVADSYLRETRPNTARADHLLQQFPETEDKNPRLFSTISLLVKLYLDQLNIGPALKWIEKGQSIGDVRDLILLYLSHQSNNKFSQLIELNREKQFLPESDFLEIVQGKTREAEIYQRSQILVQVKKVLPDPLDTNWRRLITDTLNELLDQNLEAWPLLSSYPALCHSANSDSWKLVLSHMVEKRSPVCLALAQDPSPLLAFASEEKEKEWLWMKVQLMQGLINHLPRLRGGKAKQVTRRLLQLRDEHPAPLLRKIDPTALGLLIKKGDPISLCKATKMARYSEDPKSIVSLFDAIAATKPEDTDEKRLLRYQILDSLKIIMRHNSIPLKDEAKSKIAPWVFNPVFANDPTSFKEILFYFLGIDTKDELDGKVIVNTLCPWLNASGVDSVEAAGLILNEVKNFEIAVKAVPIFVPLALYLLPQAIKQERTDLAILSQKFLSACAYKYLEILKEDPQRRMLNSYASALMNLATFLEEKRVENGLKDIEHTTLALEIQSFVNKFPQDSRKKVELCAHFLNALISPSALALIEGRDESRVMLHAAYPAFYALVNGKRVNSTHACKNALKKYLLILNKTLLQEPPDSKQDLFYLLKSLQIQLIISLANQNIECTIDEYKVTFSKINQPRVLALLIELREKQCRLLRELNMNDCESILGDLNVEISQNKASLIMNHLPYMISSNSLQDFSTILEHLYQQETDVDRKENYRGFLALSFISLNYSRRYQNEPELFREHYQILYENAPLYTNETPWHVVATDVCDREFYLMCKNHKSSLLALQDLISILQRTAMEHTLDPHLMRTIIKMLVDIAVGTGSATLSNPELNKSILNFLIFAYKRGFFDFKDPTIKQEYLTNQTLLTIKLPDILQEEPEIAWNILQACLNHCTSDRGNWTENFCYLFHRIIDNSFHPHLSDHPDRIQTVYQSLVDALKSLTPSDDDPWLYLNLRYAILAKTSIAALKIQSPDLSEPDKDQWIQLFMSLLRMSIPTTETEWELELLTEANGAPPSERLYEVRRACLARAADKSLFKNHKLELHDITEDLLKFTSDLLDRVEENTEVADVAT